MDAFLDTISGWLDIGPDYTIKYLGLRGGLPVWLLFALICLGAVLAGILYLLEPSISRGRRILLAVLRAVTYSLVLFFLFAPVIGLERSLAIRPNLLVLVDRSKSMAIADQRSQPADLADAALALGKAKFVMPDEQEGVARARRAARACAAALKQRLWDDMLAAESEAQAAFAAVLPERAVEGDGNRAPARPAQFTRTIGELAQRQKDLRVAVEGLPKGVAVAWERARQLRDKQDDICRDLDALAAGFAKAPVALTPAVRKEAAAVPRLTLAKGLLDHPGLRALDRAGKDCNVRYFSFGDKLEQISAAAETVQAALKELEPIARATRGSRAIHEAVSQFSGQPIVGVVMLTDGAFNDENAYPLTAAAWLREQGVPLHTVGLGLRAPQDVGLRSLIVQDVFFPKDLVTARLQVTSSGYSGVTTEVRATLDGKEAAKVSVDLTDEPQFVELTFPVPKGKGGLSQLAFTIPARQGEISAANNELKKPVRIIDQKIKVLYVEGRPRWEYRYLRVLLLRDPRLDVKFLMTQGDPDLAAASPEYLARYPEKPAEAFIYDLVILGDVPSWYFNRPQMERMVELVRERGGSVLMLAGEQYAPASYVDTPLAEVLPVRITRDYQLMPPEVYPLATPVGKRSFAMLEKSDSANNRVWSLVRPLGRLPRLEGAKPGANVLAELPEGPNRPEPYPLISWQYAGAGKAMYVGTDQLWRLRFKLGDRYHGRFWGQAIQFLALSRLLGENKRVRLETDKAGQIRTGQRVEIHANVLDPAFQPVKSKEYTVHVERAAPNPGAAPPGEAKASVVDITLLPVPGAEGLFQGSHVFREEGRYVLRASGDDAKFANTVDLVVAASDLEDHEPAMQESLLKKMSELSGGQYFSVREWPALPGMLEARERIVVENKEKDLWDSWPLFVLLLLSASAEWFLRRRSNLV